MRVLGQFRDLDQPDLFVWLRGFADMDVRRRALEAFYGGPVWAAHRAAANATMIDSDIVLLLRHAWPGAASTLPQHARPAPGATGTAAGVLDATLVYLHQPATPALLDYCPHRMAPPPRRGPPPPAWLRYCPRRPPPAVRRGGARQVAWYSPEPTPNTFPRLPVRAGEHV